MDARKKRGKAVLADTPNSIPPRGEHGGAVTQPHGASRQARVQLLTSVSFSFKSERKERWAGDGQEQMMSESQGGIDSVAGHPRWRVPADERLIRTLAELCLNHCLNQFVGGLRLQPPGTRPAMAMQVADAIGYRRRAVRKRCVRLAET